MSKDNQKKSLNNIVLAVIIFCIIGLTVWYVINNTSAPVNSFDGSIESLMVNKYSSSLKQLDKTLNSLDPTLFNNVIFTKLKSFISLPLEIGLKGKENPFETPLPPEDLLLQQSQ